MADYPEWYPLPADAHVTVFKRVAKAFALGEMMVFREPPEYGVRFQECDPTSSTNVFFLDPGVTEELGADGHGLPVHGARLDPERLNAAARRAVEGSWPDATG